jgi:hypothetical protein
MRAISVDGGGQAPVVVDDQRDCARLAGGEQGLRLFATKPGFGLLVPVLQQGHTGIERRQHACKQARGIRFVGRQQVETTPRHDAAPWRFREGDHVAGLLKMRQ